MLLVQTYACVSRENGQGRFAFESTDRKNFQLKGNRTISLNQNRTGRACSFCTEFFPSSSSLNSFKCPCDQKSHFLVFFRFWKYCLPNTRLAKFWALICIQRPFILSASFGFYGPPLLTFRTDPLGLRGLDPWKSDVKGSLALNFRVWMQVIIKMKREFKSLKSQNSRAAY